ncbi:MAG: ABC transporter substrate-binding protein, partial [Bacteroidota bacterium]
MLSDSGQFDPKWSRENTLTIHALTDPDNLHPCNGNSALRSEILQLTQLFLVINRYGTALEPGVITKLPDLLKDGKTYQYRLREGVYWPDGSKITTEDVIFTCKVNASGLAENTATLPYWSRVNQVTAVDSNVFSISMDTIRINDVAFLASFPILQRRFYDPTNTLGRFEDGLMSKMGSEKLKNDSSVQAYFERFNKSGIGTDPAKMHCTGLYKVKEWSNGQYIILDKRSTKHKRHGKAMTTGMGSEDRSGPEKIIYRFNRDENTVLIGLHNQTYDLSGSISSGAFKQATKDEAILKNYRLVLSPTFNYSYLCFNERPETSNRYAYFSDIQTRKAFATGVPIDDIIRLVYGEEASDVPKMASYISPLKPEYDSSLAPVEFDLKKTMDALENAGWKDLDRDGKLERRSNDGKTIKFEPELLYLNASPDWKAIAELITVSMFKCGIILKPVAVDPATFNKRARNHDFDLLLGSWSGNSLPEDPSQLWSTKSWSDNGSNYSGFGNSSTDSIIDIINKSSDEQQRKISCISLQRAIHENQPYVFLYNSMRRMIIHK